MIAVVLTITASSLPLTATAVSNTSNYLIGLRHHVLLQRASSMLRLYKHTVLALFPFVYSCIKCNKHITYVLLCRKQELIELDLICVRIRCLYLRQSQMDFRRSRERRYKIVPAYPSVDQSNESTFDFMIDLMVLQASFVPV